MRFKDLRVLSFAASILIAAPVMSEPMVGASVGNADVLSSEGSRLYNLHQYAKAATVFLKATRANPSSLQAYLSLARSYMATKQLRSACNAYRAYLKAAPESLDRGKAQSESELCERQLRSAGKQPPDPTPKFVETKATFYSALDEGRLLGSGSASEALKSLLHGGYVATDVGEMGSKLNAAASAAAEDLYRRALAREKIPVDALRKGKQLYQLAADTGSAPPNSAARTSFLEGLAALQSGDPRKANVHFTEASVAEPAVSEYKFYRAVALYRAGEKEGAFQLMQSELPNDPRTAVVRLSQALSTSSERGAAELDQLLFAKVFSASR